MTPPTPAALPPPKVFPVAAGPPDSSFPNPATDDAVRSVEGDADDTDTVADDSDHDTDSDTAVDDENDDEEAVHRRRHGFDNEDVGGRAVGGGDWTTRSSGSCFEFFCGGVAESLLAAAAIAHVYLSVLLVTVHGLWWLLLVVPLTCIILALFGCYCLGRIPYRRSGEACTATFAWTLLFGTVELAVLTSSPVPVAALGALWVALVVVVKVLGALTERRERQGMRRQEDGRGAEGNL